MRKIVAVLIFLAAFSCIGMKVAISEVEKTNFVPTEEPWFWNMDISWVDSVMSKMTLDEKIAQLIMIPVYFSFIRPAKADGKMPEKMYTLILLQR